MGSRIFCVCVIIITILCVRIVNSDVHIPSTRLRLSSGLSRRIPLKSYPANLKSLRSRIAPGSPPYSAEVKPHSFWSRFIGKSRRGDGLAAGPLASASFLASHRRNGHSNRTASAKAARKSLRVKRDNHVDQRTTASVPKNPAATITKSESVERMTKANFLTTGASKLLPRTSQESNSPSTPEKLTTGGITVAQGFKTTVSSKVGSSEKSYDGKPSAPPVTPKISFNGTSGKSVNEGTFTTTSSSVGGAVTLAATTKKYAYAQSSATTVSSGISKASFRGGAETTLAGLAWTSSKTSSSDESKSTPGILTTKKLINDGSSYVTKASASGSWPTTAARDVTSSVNVAGSENAGKSQSLTLLSTTKKSTDDGLTHSSIISKSPMDNNKISAVRSSTIGAKSGSIGPMTTATVSSLLLTDKVGSLNSGSVLSTTKVSGTSNAVTTPANLNLKPINGTNVTAEISLTTKSSIGATTKVASSQSVTVTVRNSATSQSNTATTRSNVTSQSNTATTRSNAGPQSNTVTTRSNVSPQSNTATTRSNAGPQSNTATTRSNAGPQSNTATTRSNAGPQSNTATTRSNAGPQSNMATTRSNVSPQSNTVTPKSNVTSQSNTATTRSNAGLQSNTATTRSNATSQSNTVTPKSNVTSQSNTATTRSNAGLQSNTATTRSNAGPQSNTATTRSNATSQSNTVTPKSNVTSQSNTATTRSNAAPQSNTATTKSNILSQSNDATTRSEATSQSKTATPRSNATSLSNTVTIGSNAVLQTSASAKKSTTAPLANTATARSTLLQVNTTTIGSNAALQPNTSTISSNLPTQLQITTAGVTVGSQTNLSSTKSAVTMTTSTATHGTNVTKSTVPLPISGNVTSSSQNVTQSKPTITICPFGQVFCLRQWSCIVSNDYYDLEIMRWKEWLVGHKDEVICDQSDVCKPNYYCRKKVCKLDEIYSLELDTCVKYSSSESEYHTEFPEFPHTTESPIQHLSNASHMCPKGEVYTLPVVIYCRVDTDCPLASKCCYVSKRDKNKLPSCVWIAERSECPSFMSYCSATAKCHLPTEACNKICLSPWMFCNATNRCVEAGTCEDTNSSTPETFEPFELPKELLPGLKIKSLKPLLEDCDSQRLVSDMFEIEGLVDFSLKIKEKLLLRFLQEHLSWNISHLEYYTWLTNFSAVLSVKESSVEIRSSETHNEALHFVPTVEFPCLDGILLQTAHNISGNNGDLRWSSSHCGNAGLRLKFRNIVRLQCRPNYYGKVTLRLSPLVVDINGNKTYGKMQSVEIEITPVHDPPALRLNLADVDVEIPFVTAIPLIPDPSLDEGTLVMDFTAAYFYNPDGEDLGMAVVVAQDSELGFWEFKLSDGDDWMNITDVDPSCSTLQRLGITDIHQGAVFLDGADPPDALKEKARSRRSLIFFNDTINATTAPKVSIDHPLGNKSQVEFRAFYSKDFRTLAEYQAHEEHENASDIEDQFNITQISELSLKNPWRQRHQSTSLPLECPVQPAFDDVPVTAKVNLTTLAYSQTATVTFSSRGPEPHPTAAPLTLTTTSKSGLTTTIILSSSSIAAWNSAASASGFVGVGSTMPKFHSSVTDSTNYATMTGSSNSGTTKSNIVQSSLINFNVTAATISGNSSTKKAENSASTKSFTTKLSDAQYASTNSKANSGTAATTSASSGTSGNSGYSIMRAANATTNLANSASSAAVTKPTGSSSTYSLNSASSTYSVATFKSANPPAMSENSTSNAKSANSASTNSGNIATTVKSAYYASTNAVKSATTKSSNSMTTLSANLAYSATATKSSTSATTNSAKNSTSEITSTSDARTTKSGSFFMQSTLSTAATSERGSTTATTSANAAFGTTAKILGSAIPVSSSPPTTAMPAKNPFWPDENGLIAKEVKLTTRVLFLPPTARLRFVQRNATLVRWWSILSAMTGSKFAFLAWDGSDRKKAGSRQQVTTTLCTTQNEECVPDADAALSSHIVVVWRRPLDCASQSSLMIRRVPDQCGVCGGDGRTCQDCSGTANGDAVMDCSSCVGGSTGKPLYGERDCDFQCSKTNAAKFGSSCFRSGEENFKRCDKSSNLSLIDECGQCMVAQNHSLKADVESSLCGHCADQHETSWLRNHYFKYFNCNYTWKKDSMMEAISFGLHPHLRWDSSPEFGQAVFADLAAFPGPILLLHIYGPSWSYKKEVFKSVACDLVNFAGIVVAPLRSVFLVDRLQIELMAFKVGDYRIACQMMTPNNNYHSLTPISKLTVVDSRRVWIQSCTPSSIEAKQNATLTILGEGFVNSMDLICFIFVHPSKVAKFLSKANFVSEGKVTCNVSSTTLESSTTIDVGVALSFLALGQFNAGRFPLLSSATVEIRVDNSIHLLSVHISNDWQAVIAKFDCNVQFENCYNLFSDMTDIFGKNISCKAKEDAIIIYPTAALEGLVGKAIHTSKTNEISCIFSSKSVPGAVSDAVIQKPPNEIPLSFELIGPNQVCSGNASFQVLALSGTGGKPVITCWKVVSSTNNSASGKGNELLDNSKFPPTALNITISSKILSVGLKYIVEVTVTNFLKRESSHAMQFTFSSACEASLTIVGPAVVNPQYDIFLTAQVTLSSAYSNTVSQPQLNFYWEISGSPLNINNVRGSTLMIEKGSLEGGFTYIVQCLVILNGDPKKTAVGTFNLSTSLGDPVALTSVTFLDVPVTKGFWLNGELSHDPYKPSKKLRFLWSCSSEKDGACYSVTNSTVRRLEALLNSTVQDPTLAVDGHLLAVGKYNFTLTVLTADGRQAKTFVLIKIFPQRNAPTISIAQGNDFAVRPGTEVTLRSFISAPAGTVLLWQCIPTRGNSYFDVSTSPSSGSYHLVESDVVDMPFTTTLRSSIEPTDPWWTRLMADSQYMFTLTASHPIEGTTRAHITLETVSSPSVRSVQVVPTSGMAIFTTFSVDISDFWLDESVSLLHVGFHEELQNGTSVRYLHQVNHAIPHIDIRLPAASFTSCKLVVVIKACSSDDVCSLSKSGSVQVKMPDLPTKDHLKAILTTVTDIVSRGDFTTAIAHATSCIHTLYVAGYRKGETLQRLIWITELLVRRQAARIEISVDDMYSPREEAFDTLNAACSAFKDVRPSNRTLISLMALQSKMMGAYVRRQLEIDVASASHDSSDGDIGSGTTASPVTLVGGASGWPNGTTISANVTKGFTSVSPAESAVTTLAATSLKSFTAGTITAGVPASTTKRDENNSAGVAGSSTARGTGRSSESATGSAPAGTSTRPLTSGSGSTSAAIFASGLGSTSARTSSIGVGSNSASAVGNTSASPSTSSSGSTSAAISASGLGSTSARTSAVGVGSNSASAVGNTSARTSTSPSTSSSGSTSAAISASGLGSTSARTSAIAVGSNSASAVGITSARTSASPSTSSSGSTSAAISASGLGSTSARTSAVGVGSNSASAVGNTSASPSMSSSGSTSAAISASGLGSTFAMTSDAPSTGPANGSLSKTMALEKGSDSPVHIDNSIESAEFMRGGYVKQIVDGLKRLFRVGRSTSRRRSSNKNSGVIVASRPLGSQKANSLSFGSNQMTDSNQQAVKPVTLKLVPKSGTPKRKPDDSENNAIQPQAKAGGPEKTAEVSEKKDVKSEAKAEKLEKKAKISEKIDVRPEAKPEKSSKKVEKQEKKIEKSEKEVKKHEKKTKEYEKQAKKYDKKAETYEKKAEKSKQKAERSRIKAEEAKLKSEKSKKDKNDHDTSSDLDVRHAANGQTTGANQNNGWQQRRPRGTTVYFLSSTNHRRYRYRRSPTKPGLLPGNNSPAQNPPLIGEISGSTYLISEPNQPISAQQAETLLGITDLALTAGSASPAALYQQLLTDLPDLWMAMCLGAMPSRRPIVAVSKTVILQVAKVDAEKAVGRGDNYPFVDATDNSKGFVMTSSYFHLNDTSKMNTTDFACNGDQSDCGIVCLGSAHFKKDPLTTALGVYTNNPSTGLLRGNVVALLPVFYADSQEISLLDVVDLISLNISVDKEDVSEAEIPYLKCAAWSNDHFSWNANLCNTSGIFRSTKSIRVSCTCLPTGFFCLHLDRAQVPIKSVAETTTTTTTPVTPKTNPTTKSTINSMTTSSANATTASFVNATSTQPASVLSSSSLNPSSRKNHYQVGFIIDGVFEKIVINSENFIHLMTEQFAALLNVTEDTFSSFNVQKGSVKVTMVVTPDPNSQYGDGTQLVEHIHKLIAEDRFCFKGENNETLCAQKDSYHMTQLNNEETYQRQSMVGTIVGAVFGIVICIVVLCILKAYVKNKRKRNKIAQMQASMREDAEASANYKHLPNAPTIPQTYAPIEGTIDSREQYRMRFSPSPNMVPNDDGPFNYPSLTSEGHPDDPSDDYLRPASRISTFAHPASPEAFSGGPASLNLDHPNNSNPLSENPQHDKPSSRIIAMAPQDLHPNPPQLPRSIQAPSPSNGGKR